MNLSLQSTDTTALLDQLGTANLAFQKTYPGDRPDRQPVHTVYGGANLFKADTCVRMGEIALRNLQTYAPNFVELARVLQLAGHEHLPTLAKDIDALSARLDALTPDERRQEPAWLAHAVYTKIVQKLASEPIEDFRIDFEDGFGNRPDAEEDATAVQAAHETAKGMREG
ncbi:MAG: phosphoenolpyruvate kinase, partial [Cytophagaceae bacterium]